MEKYFEKIKKAYSFIQKNNIHIWGLIVILFIISLIKINVQVVDKEVKYPKAIAVTGDSYAGFLMTYEDLKAFGMVGYAIAGKSAAQNYYRMKEAMHQDLDIVVISMGVNEVINNTEPAEFAKLYHSLLLEGSKYGKTIITHTYLDFKYNSNICKYKPFDYDVAIRKEMYNFDNVYYIDMRDYEKEEYLQDDKIHYNKAFYDVFYERLKSIIDNKYTEDVKKAKESINIDLNLLYASFFALLLSILVLKIVNILKSLNCENHSTEKR